MSNLKEELMLELWDIDFTYEEVSELIFSPIRLNLTIKTGINLSAVVPVLKSYLLDTWRLFLLFEVLEDDTQCVKVSMSSYGNTRICYNDLEQLLRIFGLYDDLGNIMHDVVNVYRLPDFEDEEDVEDTLKDLTWAIRRKISNLDDDFIISLN